MYCLNMKNIKQFSSKVNCDTILIHILNEHYLHILTLKNTKNEIFNVITCYIYHRNNILKPIFKIYLISLSLPTSKHFLKISPSGKYFKGVFKILPI